MRVCLDTNVLVAAVATRGICADLMRAVLTRHELVIGDVILDELREVLVRKFKVADEGLRAMERTLAGVPVVPRPAHAPMPGLRDPSDRWVVATALAGDADVLVSGDQDLLSVREDAPLPILSPRECWMFLLELDRPPQP